MNTAILEYRLLYSMVVAGKSATFAENAMKRFLAGAGGRHPFEYIRALLPRGLLIPTLKEARTGNYTKLSQGFADAAQTNIDLETVPPELLEMQLHGVGPKTSRFFIIWTRPWARHAALDTHVLKWLRYLGHEAPLSTPSGLKYVALEKLVLREADARGMSARDLDAQIWDWASQNTKAVREGIWPDPLKR